MMLLPHFFRTAGEGANHALQNDLSDMAAFGTKGEAPGNFQKIACAWGILGKLWV